MMGWLNSYIWLVFFSHCLANLTLGSSGNASWAPYHDVTRVSDSSNTLAATNISSVRQVMSKSYSNASSIDHAFPPSSVETDSGSNTKRHIIATSTSLKDDVTSSVSSEMTMRSPTVTGSTPKWGTSSAAVNHHETSDGNSQTAEKQSTFASTQLSLNPSVTTEPASGEPAVTEVINGTTTVDLSQPLMSVVTQTVTETVTARSVTAPASVITETVTESGVPSSATKTITEYGTSAPCSVPISDYSPLISSSIPNPLWNTSVTEYFTQSPSASFSASNASGIASHTVNRASNTLSTAPATSTTHVPVSNCSNFLNQEFNNTCTPCAVDYVDYQFPYPYPGMDLQNWRARYNSWAGPIPSSTYNPSDYSLFSPRLTVKQNLFFLNIRCLPNQGKEFSVDGLHFDQAIWVTEAPNRTKEDPVILFLHGGSYFWGLIPSQTGMLYDLIKKINNPRLSLMVLDYTLGTERPYPYQLNETILLYNELLKSSSNIIIFTDSSGAHLGLQFLLHQANPYPSLPKVPVNNATTGLAMSSPWSDYSGLANSFIWTWALGANVANPLWFQPQVVAPANDSGINWKPVLPQSVFISYGESDTVVNSSKAFIRNAGLRSDQYYVVPRGIHDSMVTIGDDNVLNRFANFFQDTF